MMNFSLGSLVYAVVSMVVVIPWTIFTALIKVEACIG